MSNLDKVLEQMLLDLNYEAGLCKDTKENTNQWSKQNPGRICVNLTNEFRIL